MNLYNKRYFVILSVLLLLILSACGQSSKDRASDPKTGEAPGSNQRIASLSIHVTNNLLALGIKPVGSVIGGDVKDFLPHVADQLQGVTKLGAAADPDMEALLSLKPDVIYIDSTLSGTDKEKYEKIAPVVAIDLDEGTWRDQLQEIAVKLGKEKEAHQFIKDYDAKAEKVQQLIHDELGTNAKVMAVRLTAKELRVMSTKRPLGPILYQDLKLKMASGVEKIDNSKPFEVISKEVLPDYDADAIFVIVSSGTKAKNAFGDLENSALWKNLKAVKHNHVYVLDGQKWLDYSAIGQNLALDDAEKLFTK
ncbi:iron-hydroxamate ABC transporter substrate-binding protein [Paenibacillus sp. JX-17]|uniref:Iron-hydroxamate ABC transporter substrate-binding protein n=1 Tax=Paenibacillus lacisoli TaxID=3064525 RepID=A0ABT9C6F8_9BACL|nr:iron-hydroxamate ABC transporter substrate-binding protein [Paenibacillus sp. JX-17]MDO7904844.1 iron-hydroxamate ABC transporter substrate-binding protein [Paenibacillus sp. JX-17]